MGLYDVSRGLPKENLLNALITLIIMKKISKDKVITAISVILLLFTAMISWNVYSWLILVAIIMLLVAWYSKK
jgi:hypothetical protein